MIKKLYLFLIIVLLSANTVNAWESCYQFSDVVTNYTVALGNYDFVVVNFEGSSWVMYRISGDGISTNEYNITSPNEGITYPTLEITSEGQDLIKLWTRDADTAYGVDFDVCQSPYNPAPTPTSTIPEIPTPTATATTTATPNATSDIPGNYGGDQSCLPGGNCSQYPDRYSEGDYENLGDNSLPSDSTGFKEVLEDNGYKANVRGGVAFLQDNMILYLFGGIVIFAAKLLGGYN